MKYHIKIFGKLLITIALLICLLDMPYGYYQLVRFLSMIFFGILAISYYNEKQSGWMYFYGASAILLNPIIKIALGRTIWNIVDVVLAVVIIIDLIIEIKKTRYNNIYKK